MFSLLAIAVQGMTEDSKVCARYALYADIRFKRDTSIPGLPSLSTDLSYHYPFHLDTSSWMPGLLRRHAYLGQAVTCNVSVLSPLVRRRLRRLPPASWRSLTSERSRNQPMATAPSRRPELVQIQSIVCSSPGRTSKSNAG